jgi:hypothetical protein
MTFEATSVDKSSKDHFLARSRGVHIPSHRGRSCVMDELRPGLERARDQDEHAEIGDRHPEGLAIGGFPARLTEFCHRNKDLGAELSKGWPSAPPDAVPSECEAPA